jgi:hypothetical protein
MNSKLLMATILLTASGTAWAAPPADETAATGTAAASTETASTEPEEPAEEKKICRTERATGSLTRRTRICMTEAQWRETNSRTYKGVTEIQRSTSAAQTTTSN